MKKKFSPVSIAVCAVLLALQVVLSRFLSINTPVVRFGFAFIPVAIVAVLYGIPGAVVVCALGDIIGALVLPTGAYFPGFTFTAVLMGLCYGLCLKDLPRYGTLAAFLRIAVCAFVNQFVLSLFLNTFWISLTAGKAFSYFFVTRLISSAADFAVQTVILFLLYKVKFFKKVSDSALKARR